MGPSSMKSGKTDGDEKEEGTPAYFDWRPIIVWCTDYITNYIYIYLGVLVPRDCYILSILISNRFLNNNTGYPQTRL